MFCFLCRIKKKFLDHINDTSYILFQSLYNLLGDPVSLDSVKLYVFMNFYGTIAQ